MHKSLLKFIYYFLKPFKFWVLAYISLAIISGLWGVFNSLLIKEIINTLVAADNNAHDLLSTVFWPAVLLLLNFQIHDMSWRGLDLINYKIQPQIKNNILSYAFSYVCRHSYQFFQNNFAGKIASNINILDDNIEKIVNQLSWHIIRATVLLTASLITMYVVNPEFFYGLLVWTIVLLAVTFSFAPKIRTLHDQHAANESAFAGVIVDAITNSHNIRLFGRNRYEMSFLAKSFDKLQMSFRRKVWFVIKTEFLQGLLVLLLLAFMIYTLVKLKAVGAISIGDFSLIFGLSLDVGWTVWWIASEQLGALNDAIGRSRQSMKSLFVAHELQDAATAVALQVTAGRIVFDKVSFNYPDAEPLFKGKSIVIEPGQKVGLVGYSGGGKTTFVNLILRLYDLTAGRILIDGQDIKLVTQESLHNAIGMIPQDPSLFHRSLLENIIYGNLEASEAEVISATKRAQAHDFIMNLPQGYASLVGERGIKLSGGQRQRVSIARAMLKNAPILILDEATSQLDSVTEHVIQEVLWELMQGKTSIVIAHRLSTLLNMDRILVFEKGEIVEDGTHYELLAKAGVYQRLWDAQVGGFLLDQQDTSARSEHDI